MTFKIEGLPGCHYWKYQGAVDDNCFLRYFQYERHHWVSVHYLQDIAPLRPYFSVKHHLFTFRYGE